MRMLVAALGLALLAAAGWWWTSSRPEAILRAACEAEVKARLVTASSYRFQEVSDLYVEEATLEDYLGWDVRSKRAWQTELAERMPEAREHLDLKRQRYAGMTKPMRYLLFLTYEGNRRGIGRVSGPSSCQVVVPDGSFSSDVAKSGLMVDGFTGIEWAMYRLDQVRR